MKENRYLIFYKAFVQQNYANFYSFIYFGYSKENVEPIELPVEKLMVPIANDEGFVKMKKTIAMIAMIGLNQKTSLPSAYFLFSYNARCFEEHRFQ